MEHRALFETLCEVATRRGFRPPDTTLRVQRDQIPLDGWSIEQRGPGDGKADFLLAVTAPKVPSISPVPVMKTVSGPLFSVIVMDTYFGVWRERLASAGSPARRETAVGGFSEFKDSVHVLKEFEQFLESLR